MKKKTVKKLVLNRESVRELEEGRLLRLAGGVYTHDFAVTCKPLPPPRSVMPNPCQQ